MSRRTTVLFAKLKMMQKRTRMIKRLNRDCESLHITCDKILLENSCKPNPTSNKNAVIKQPGATAESGIDTGNSCNSSDAPDDNKGSKVSATLKIDKQTQTDDINLEDGSFVHLNEDQYEELLSRGIFFEDSDEDQDSGESSFEHSDEELFSGESWFEGSDDDENQNRNQDEDEELFSGESWYVSSEEDQDEKQKQDEDEEIFSGESWYESSDEDQDKNQKQDEDEEIFSGESWYESSDHDLDKNQKQDEIFSGESWYAGSDEDQDKKPNQYRDEGLFSGESLFDASDEDRDRSQNHDHDEGLFSGESWFDSSDGDRDKNRDQDQDEDRFSGESIFDGSEDDKNHDQVVELSSGEKDEVVELPRRRILNVASSESASSTENSPPRASQDVYNKRSGSPNGSPSSSVIIISDSELTSEDEVVIDLTRDFINKVDESNPDEQPGGSFEAASSGVAEVIEIDDSTPVETLQMGADKEAGDAATKEKTGAEAGSDTEAVKWADLKYDKGLYKGTEATQKPTLRMKFIELTTPHLTTRTFSCGDDEQTLPFRKRRYPKVENEGITTDVETDIITKNGFDSTVAESTAAKRQHKASSQPEASKSSEEIDVEVIEDNSSS